MSIIFTSEGVEIQSLAEVTEELSQNFRDIYGPDINLNPESPDGQRVGIQAKLVADMQAFALSFYNQQDPDLATGAALRSKIKYAGITSRPATRSQADLTVLSTRSLVLDNGFTVIDELGQEWATDAPNNISAGTNTITVFAKDFGAIEADTSTINKVVTVVIGITAVNNSGPATIGVDEETDEQLRKRRAKSVQLPAFTPLGSVIAKLANIAGVTDVVAYENDTNSYDPIYDMAAHSIWAIVEGGDVVDIAKSLAYKTAGAGTKGGTTGVYVENIVRPVGAPFIINHTLNFDRPNPVPIYIRLYVKRKNPSQPAPTGTILQKLIDRLYIIGQNIVASELYETVYQAGDTFIAYDLEISLDGISYTDTEIIVGFDGKPFIDPSNITISEVL